MIHRSGVARQTSGQQSVAGMRIDQKVVALTEASHPEGMGKGTDSPPFVKPLARDFRRKFVGSSHRAAQT